LNLAKRKQLPKPPPVTPGWSRERRSLVPRAKARLSELPKQRIRQPTLFIVPPMEEREVEIAHFIGQVHRANDLDPNIPVVRELCRMRGYDGEQQRWFVLVYAAYHNLPSAVVALRLLGDRLASRGHILSVAPQLNELPVTVQRRVVSGHVAEYLAALVECIGDPTAPDRLQTFMDYGWSPEDRQRVWNKGRSEYYRYTLKPSPVLAQWRKFRRRWEKLPGQDGRWLTYETARLLRYVVGLPYKAPHLALRTQGLHQPAAALWRLYGYHSGWGTVVDRLAEMFRASLWRNEVAIEDWELIEFAIRKAVLYIDQRYYVGFGIDEMLSRINRLPELQPEERAELLQARAACFEPRYLGEVNDWSGVRRSLLPPREDFHLRLLRPVGSK